MFDRRRVTALYMPLVYAYVLAVVLIGAGIRAFTSRGLGLTRYRSTHGLHSRIVGGGLIVAGLDLIVYLATHPGTSMWLRHGQTP